MEIILLIVLFAIIGVGGLKVLTSLLMPSPSAIGRVGENRVNRQALLLRLIPRL